MQAIAEQKEEKQFGEGRATFIAVLCENSHYSPLRSNFAVN